MYLIIYVNIYVLALVLVPLLVLVLVPPTHHPPRTTHHPPPIHHRPKIFVKVACWQWYPSILRSCVVQGAPDLITRSCLNAPTEESISVEGKKQLRIIEKLNTSTKNEIHVKPCLGISDNINIESSPSNAFRILLCHFHACHVDGLMA